MLRLTVSLTCISRQVLVLAMDNERMKVWLCYSKSAHTLLQKVLRDQFLPFFWKKIWWKLISNWLSKVLRNHSFLLEILEEMNKTLFSIKIRCQTQKTLPRSTNFFKGKNENFNFIGHYSPKKLKWQKFYIAIRCRDTSTVELKFISLLGNRKHLTIMEFWDIHKIYCSKLP